MKMRSSQFGDEVVIARWKKNQKEDAYYPPPKPYSVPSRTLTKTHNPSLSPSQAITEKQINEYFHKLDQRIENPQLLAGNIESISPGSDSSDKDMSPVIAPRFYSPKPVPQYWKTYPSPDSRSMDCSRWCTTFTIVITVLVVMIIVLFIILLLIFGLQVFNEDGDDMTHEAVGPSVNISQANATMMAFYGFELNATDAEEYCENRKGHLLVIENSYEESRLFEILRNNQTLLGLCRNAYLGYRSLQSKEWVSLNGEFGFQAMYTNFWNELSYDSALENCSHSAKVLDYKLNPTTCNFLNDCIMCQVKTVFFRGKPNEEGPRFFLEKKFTTSYEQAAQHCRQYYDGILASIPNAVIYKRFNATIHRDTNKLKKCSSIAIGMILKRKLGLMDINAEEIEVNYVPQSFSPTLGSIKENCVVVSLHAQPDTIKFVDCSQENCFICMNNSLI